MPRIRKRASEYRENSNEWIPKIYDNWTLSEFDKKIRAKFTVEREVDVPIKEKVKFVDTTEFLKHVGALSKLGAVIIRQYKHCYGSGPDYHTWSCETPTKYEYWNNLLEQWRNFCSKKDYGIKQTGMELQKTADSFTLPNNFYEEDI
jgi:hypothetical protein